MKNAKPGDRAAGQPAHPRPVPRFRSARRLFRDIVGALIASDCACKGCRNRSCRNRYPANAYKLPLRKAAGWGAADRSQLAIWFRELDRVLLSPIIWR
jgi:hypothetical protein